MTTRDGGTATDMVNSPENLNSQETAMPRKSHPLPTAITCDDDEIYRRIGVYLHIARKVNKMTQAELASLVGIERTSVTNVEKGQQRLPLHLLYKFCKVLEIDICDLLPDVDEICQTY